MTTRRIVLLCATFIFLVAAAPFIDAVWFRSIQIGPDDFASYRLPLKAHPDNPASPMYAYSEMIDWDRFGQFDVPGFSSLVYGDYPWSGKYAQVIQVSKGKAPTVICGATCTSATSTCITGSAIASITDSSITKPYIVHVNSGIYPECVSIDEKTDIALVGSGWLATIIRPTVTTGASVAGGVCRIGIDANDSANPRNETRRIELAELTCHNDASSSPESGVQVGHEGGAGAGLASTWNDVYLHNYRSIGAHDSTQVWGSNVTTDSDVPRIIIRDAVMFAGADTLVLKAFLDAQIHNVSATAWSNYCESTDTANLAAETGTARCASAACSSTSFDLAASGVSAVDDFYTGRWVYPFGGACSAVPATSTAWVAQITDYVASTGRVTTTTMPTTPDATCSYYIWPVVRPEESPCQDFDWSTVNSAWKMTGFHYGTHDTPASTPAGHKVIVTDSRFAVKQKDFGPTAVSCGSQAVIAAVSLNYIGTQRSRYQDFRGITAEVTIDAPVITTNVAPCIAQVGGALVTAGNADGPNIFSGSTRIVNNVSSGGGFTCYGAVSAGTSNLTVRDSYCDIDQITSTSGLVAAGSTNTSLVIPVHAVDAYTNRFVRLDSSADPDCVVPQSVFVTADNGTTLTVNAWDALTLCVPLANDTFTAGFLGTSTSIVESNSDPVTISGSFSSPDVITTTGTITGWSENCLPIGFGTGGWAATSDNIAIPVTDANVGLQVAYVGCRCQGTCTVAAESLTFVDETGTNAFSGAVACVDNNADMTWTDVRADVDALIPASKSPRFDTTVAPTVTTDNLQVCLRYSTSRFAP